MICFLGEKVLREKHYDTLGRTQFRVINMNKQAWEGGVTLKQMKVRRRDLKVLAKGVATQVHVQREEVDALKKLLKEAQDALESTKKWVS